MVDGTHPLSVTFGQVVVHGDQVGASPCQSVEHHRHGGHQCLSLSRAHFNHVAEVEDCAAHYLHIIVPEAGGANACLPHRCEDGGHHILHQALFQLEQVSFQALDLDLPPTALVAAGHIALAATFLKLASR